MSPVVGAAGSLLSALPARLSSRVKQSFDYSTGPALLPVAAGSTAQDTIQVNTDADFVAFLVTGTARDPAAPEVVVLDPALTIQVTLAGSGVNLLNRSTDWRNLVGTGELPAILPVPLIISAGSQITTTVENLTAADDMDVRVSYVGGKLYDVAQE